VIHDIAQQYPGCYLTIDGVTEVIQCGSSNNSQRLEFDDFYITDIQLNQNQYSLSLTGLLVYIGDTPHWGGFFVNYRLISGKETVYTSKAPVVAEVLSNGDSVRFNDLIPNLGIPVSQLEVEILGVSK